MSSADQTQDTSFKKESNRERIIRAVQTPLSFFVLVVLIVEAILGIVAGLSKGGDRTLAIGGILIIFVSLIAVVVFLAYYRPEALRGLRADLDSERIPVFGGSPRFQKVVVVNSKEAKRIAHTLDDQITQGRRLLTQDEEAHCKDTGYDLDRIGLYIWERKNEKFQEVPLHIRHEFQIVERTKGKPTHMPLYYALESYQEVLNKKKGLHKKRILQENKGEFQDMLKFFEEKRPDLGKNDKVKKKLQELINQAE